MQIAEKTILHNRQIEASPLRESGYRAIVRVKDKKPSLDCYYTSPLFDKEEQALHWLPNVKRPNPFKPVFNSIRKR